MASGYGDELRFDILDPNGVQKQYDRAGSATPLQESCRAKILKSVGLSRLARASELPIPQAMVNVLMEQLRVEDFFINRDHVSGEHVSNCVYPGKCLLDDKDVVLKCIPPCLASEDLMLLANQWTELRHPNLMRYFAQFTQGGTHVIVFEGYQHALPGILYERQSKGRPIPKRLVWKALVELCSVLKYLVDNQVSYEKLSPEKITFDKDGSLKLESGIMFDGGDFGAMQMAMASPEAVYSPPEILEGQAYSGKSHVWVLGCLLVDLVNLEPAFPVSDGNMFGAMSDIMEGNPSGIDKLDGTLREVVKQCLLNNPEERSDISELQKKANTEMEKSEYTEEKIWDF